MTIDYSITFYVTGTVATIGAICGLVSYTTLHCCNIRQLTHEEMDYIGSVDIYINESKKTADEV